MGRSATAAISDTSGSWSMPQVAAETTARLYLARSLCCAVEVRSPRGIGGRASWEPRLIVLRGGSVRHVMDAIADTVRALPHHEVRIAGYDSCRLTRVERPPPLVCVCDAA